MKYSDDLFDINHNLAYASIFGILCGIASGLATIYSIEAAYIFIGILIVLSLANFKLFSIYNFLSSISNLEAYPGNIVLAPDNIILLYNVGLTSIAQDYKNKQK